MLQPNDKEISMSKKYEKTKSNIWPWAVGLASLVIVILLFNTSNNAPSGGSGAYLTPASGLGDVHGLAVDVADSSKVWIASHRGLYALQNDKDLYVVGSGRDDYMGFSAHPTDPKVFFSSGHPAAGGNIGFQKTTDTAKTWQHVSDGANGPVDFHAMAVSQIDPNLMYGWYRGSLQRSTDGGQAWQLIDSTLNSHQVVGLTTDSKDRNSVFATTDTGILVSRDQSNTWSKLTETLGENLATALAINPANNQELLAYIQNQGLEKSSDGGRSWTKIETPLASQMVMSISFDKNNPNTIYAVNQSLELYKSIDSGGTWTEIRKLRNE